MFRTRPSFLVLVVSLFLAGCGGGSTSPGSGQPANSKASPAVAVARADVEEAAKAAAANVAVVKRSSRGRSGSTAAPVILFEERHNSKAGQIQEAMAMLRLHDRYGLKNIALEGYLKDEPPINTEWMLKASNSASRPRVIISLLKEGEISSAEFMKLSFDDVKLHPIEKASEYNVGLSAEGEDAPILYLVAVAQKSLKQEHVPKLLAFKRKIQALPANSVAQSREQDKLMRFIVGVDPWANEKFAALSDPKKSMAMSGEQHLALAEEIEKRATQANLDIPSNQKSGMANYLAFWRGRMGASQTMVDSIVELANRPDVTVVVAPIGAFHTEGMCNLLEKANCPFAVLTPLSLKNDQNSGDLSGKAFERKYQRQSVFSEGLSKLLAPVFATRAKNKKPQNVLETEWFQAKTETYSFTDRIVRQVLGGPTTWNSSGDGKGPGGAPPPAAAGAGGSVGPPPNSGGGSAPPPAGSGGPLLFGFNNDDFHGKRVYVDPRRIEIVPAAPGSKRKAVLFPIIINRDDPDRRTELWVKATFSKEDAERRTAEELLAKALTEVQRERAPRTKAEDKIGRIQITDDIHAAVSKTRRGALSVSLGV